VHVLTNIVLNILYLLTFAINSVLTLVVRVNEIVLNGVPVGHAVGSFVLLKLRKVTTLVFLSVKTSHNGV